jgi:aminotransferase in exopolysaccharide biosynthesis
MSEAEVKEFKQVIISMRKMLESFYQAQGPFPLHIPQLDESDKKRLIDCIDSTFVSSVGKEIEEAERRVADYTGSKRAVAVVNGTAALQVGLRLVGVDRDTEVLTQPLTFVATANAIAYLGAIPNFIDVSRDSMALSYSAIKLFLEEKAEIREGICYNRKTERRISACVPMHTFGFSAEIEEIVRICSDYNIPVVEDAAEALGSKLNGKHLGTFGKVGTLSFNGNKVITSGGGGMILTNDEALADRAKHLTTTAKVAHAYEYVHDELGYNYRMPNLNAALLLAQLDKLDHLLEKKRELFKRYRDLFERSDISLKEERANEHVNYWLMAIVLGDREQRDAFLASSNESGVMTRPIWELMYRLPMYQDAPREACPNAEWLIDRVVNIPSSAYL